MGATSLKRVHALKNLAQWLSWWYHWLSLTLRRQHTQSNGTLVTWDLTLTSGSKLLESVLLQDTPRSEWSKRLYDSMKMWRTDFSLCRLVKSHRGISDLSTCGGLHSTGTAQEEVTCGQWRQGMQALGVQNWTGECMSSLRHYQKDNMVWTKPALYFKNNGK